MKILHVTKKYPNALGGDATVVANLEKQQKKAGHEVVILTSNCDEIKIGKSIYKFGLKDTPSALDKITPKRLVSLIMLYFQAYKVLEAERPDVIHTHSIDMAFFVSFAARHYKIPIVHTFHVVTFNNRRQSVIRRKTELFLLRTTRPRRILVLNPAIIDDFTRAGFPDVSFVPNGINIEDWQNKNPKSKNKKFTFIAVGRLEEQKGFSYLIEAAAMLLESHREFQIQIVGEGSLHSKLQEQIEGLNLSKYVFLLGKRKPEQLRELYANADVFVLSSLWEGMPLTLFEAWAAGLPAIATKVDSVPFIGGDLAELIERAQPQELESAMVKFIEKPELMNSLSKKAYQMVVKKYQWSALAKEVEKRYA